MVGGSAFSGESRQRRSIHEKDIEPAIIIVIEDRDTRACALEDIGAGIIAAKNVCCSQSCLLSHISELSDLRSSVLSSRSCCHGSKNGLPNDEQNPATVLVH